MHQERLDGAGWQASVVPTATEALSRLRGGPAPDAVIFGIVLPDMTDVVFLKRCMTLSARETRADESSSPGGFSLKPSARP
jgi:CheY-like chemotaxis protein